MESISDVCLIDGPTETRGEAGTRQPCGQILEGGQTSQEVTEPTRQYPLVEPTALERSLAKVGNLRKDGMLGCLSNYLPFMITQDQNRTLTAAC